MQWTAGYSRAWYKLSIATRSRARRAFTIVRFEIAENVKRCSELPERKILGFNKLCRKESDWKMMSTIHFIFFSLPFHHSWESLPCTNIFGIPTRKGIAGLKMRKSPRIELDREWKVCWGVLVQYFAMRYAALNASSHTFSSCSAPTLPEQQFDIKSMYKGEDHSMYTILCIEHVKARLGFFWSRKQ